MALCRLNGFRGCAASRRVTHMPRLEWLRTHNNIIHRNIRQRTVEPVQSPQHISRMCIYTLVSRR